MAMLPEPKSERPPTFSPRVRSHGVMALVEYVAHAHGADGVVALENALSPTERAAVDSLSLGAWSSFALWQAVAHTAANLFADAANDTARFAYVRAMGRFGADRDVTLVHRVLMRIGTVQFLLERATSLWRSLNDHGEMRVVRLGSAGSRCELRGWPAPDRLFCASIEGWIERYLELCGAKGITGTHTQCVALGDAVCAWEGHWSAGRS